MLAFPSWSTLPTEIRLAIVDLLGHDDLSALSRASSSSHALCLPRLFQSVTIPSFPALQTFLRHVPVHYGSYIRALDVRTLSPLSPSAAATITTAGTPRTDALIRLFSATPRLERLTLRLSGGLAPKALPCFRSLERLSDLAIENCEDEVDAPLSERIVVGIALALPNLTRLRLTRITRSLQYADDIYPNALLHPDTAFIPFVYNDQPSPDCPASIHPPHCLPSLLSIPTLRHLSIRDTHLGDARFASSDLPVNCRLQTLDIGAYEGCSPSEGARWTTAIMSHAGSDLIEAVLGAGLPQLTRGALHLPLLRKLRLTPCVSPMHIPSTLASALEAGAPVEHVDVECLQEDIEDVAEELISFLSPPVRPCLLKELQLRVLEDLAEDILAEPSGEDAVLDEDSTRIVRKLAAVAQGAGMRFTLVGASTDGMSVDREKDWESDEGTVVGEHDHDVDMDMDKAAMRVATAAVGIDLVEEDSWARMGEW